jgi:L-alanine-DL-glutamate epimerase-like enolase superfamily enzyme
VATSATRGSNDAVVRRVSKEGVTGSGGVVGGELKRQQLESVAPLLDGLNEPRTVRNSHSASPSLGTRV